MFKAISLPATTTINLMNQITKNGKNKVRTSIKKSADIIQKDASKNANRKTGFMAENIETQEITNGYEVIGKAPYTRWQEEGTKRIKAHNFLLNAFNKEKGNVVKNTNLI